jgi:NAD(P)H-hydrate repair Nnr-like enzyme with NAD(P)H-hydrate epimerase domain
MAAMALWRRGDCMSGEERFRLSYWPNPDELRGDAAVMFGKLPGARLSWCGPGEELKSERVRPCLQADLYLDAVLGTGFKPPVSGLYADAIAIMNASQSSRDRG